jgi:hypothetical protein
MKDRDSSASWTLVPDERGRTHGLIVDSLRSEPELWSRCRAGMVDRMLSVMMSSREPR